MKNKILKKLLYAVGTILVLVGLMEVFVFSKHEEEKMPPMVLAENNAKQPVIPGKLDFAGEPVPIENGDVKESLDRELLVNVYWHSQTILMLKRANRFFPVIEPILKEYGVPDDFKYIPVIESGLTNNSSSAGARGFWQIIESTGKEYGLEINNDVDERLNLEKSTRVACQFFLKSHKKFGNWPMVAASYNMGMSGVGNSAENQGSNNYYDLWLNTETARYVYRIVAMKMVMENPRLYGIELMPEDLYPAIPTTDVELNNSAIDVAQIAKNLNVSYKTLKTFNPWLVSTIFPNKGKKTYIFKIPQGNYRELTFGKKQQ